MKNTTVLVVDDSLTMRALISGSLEKVKGIDVLGAANGADQARTMIRDLDPDVITLDIEMPGMSGIEFLEELMSSAPRPVVMFSTLTQKGAAASVDALRLGAIDCFPKPKVATPAELAKIIDSLAKTLKTASAKLAARTSGGTPGAPAGGAAEAKSKARALASEPFTWNGKLVAIGADISNTQMLFELLESMPVNCPPILVVQQIRPELADSIAAQLSEIVLPKVVKAADATRIEPGHIYLAEPEGLHMVIDRWPDGTIRLLDKPAVLGQRPSISLLYAALAKAGGRQTLGVLLGAEGEDGVAGAKAMRDAGGLAITPVLDADKIITGYEFGSANVREPVEIAKLARVILTQCRG
ncbi:MAG TPA: chemotaxis protein CheB [Sphingomonas sp.]|jgi:two-component system chemotaxis response regulator CheB|uniref:chemotaxis protein CheB n=1 Tax=Sphingomonas sp. TaxID=28214 RepID=UPI002EDA5525